MENNIENIDLVILEKEYHQLLPEEKLAINEFIADETEYNDIKLMLTAVKAQLVDESEIIPNPAIKEQLVESFKKHVPVPHLNDSKMGLVFFFPKEKSFFEKPGVRILMAAAGIALMIGFSFTFDFNKNEETLAKVETKVAEKTSIQSEQSAPQMVAMDSANEELSSDVASQPTITLPIEEMVESPGIDKNKSNMMFAAQDDQKNKNAFEANKKEEATESIVASDNVLFENESVRVENNAVTSGATTNFTTLSSSASYQSKTTTTSVSTSRVNASSTASVDDESSSNTNKDRNASSPKKSKTLAENAELISYFYTAM